MKEIKAEEYFSIGFEQGKRNYWTIFFNFLIYAVLCVCAAITVVGILIVPAILVGFIKFLLNADNETPTSTSSPLAAFNKNLINPTKIAGTISIPTTVIAAHTHKTA
jgi:hypothetical protein